MKRISNIIAALAVSFFALSCAREILPDNASSSVNGCEHDGKVTFTFTPHLMGIPDDNLTKAFNSVPSVDGGLTSTIRNIYFAVFDANGYKLSEYAAAVPNTFAVLNSPNVYSYSVELTVTDQPRIIHIIANAPERIPYGSETEVIGSIFSSFDDNEWDGEDTYWNRIFLEHGVWAQPDPADAGMPGYQERLEKYIEVRDLLSEARLIRNFAKISVVNSATNFKATRFWLTNVPEIGSIAPYNRNTGRFQIDYSSYTNVDELRGTGTNQGNYQGFMPVSSGLYSIQGKDVSWLNSHAVEIDPETGGSSFCFEREVPKSNPLYVIVGGRYDSNGDGVFNEDESFYKIDLRDSEGEYFPILRNFDYRINVNIVKRVGASSVEAALSSAPSGDISTSIGLGDLTNISNGVSQIVVSETSRVIVGTSDGTEDVGFKFKYIPNLSVSNGGFAVVCNNVLTDPAAIATAIANHDSYVTIEYSYGATGEVFNHSGGNPWTIAPDDTEDDFREIEFHPVGADVVVRTEEITITGHYWNQESNNGSGAWEKMSRVVTYRLREKLNMTLSVTPSKIPTGLGEAIDLTMRIEAGLPSSIFTLPMTIETGKLSLTTNGDMMPVTTGATTIPGSSAKSAFAFTKAITWEEYNAAPIITVGDNEIYKDFTCHFKTSAASISGNSDEIWVSNPYFNQNHIGFTTYTAKTFSNIALNPSSGVHVGDNVALSFRMSSLPDDRTVFVCLKGFEPDSGTGLTRVGSDSDGYEIYSFTASSTNVSGINIVPFMIGSCYVKLMADEFTTSAPVSIEALRPAIFIWADEQGDDSGATDWIQPQNFKVYNNNLIVGQTAKLTIYCSEPGLSTITIGDLQTTNTGASITREGITLYPYTTTGVYEAPTTRQNVSMSVKNGSKVVGGYTVPVWGISRGTALTSTTHSLYNSNGTGWYIFVNSHYPAYHLRSNGTNIVGSNAADDYNSLFGFSSTSNTVKVMVPSRNATPYYAYGNRWQSTTLTLTESGTDYTFQSNSGYYRLSVNNNRYWSQTSNTGLVNISNSNYYNFTIYPVSFTEP